MNILARGKKHTRRHGNKLALTNAKDAIEANSKDFIPWRVEFAYYPDAVAENCQKPTRVVMFARAINPGAAASKAMLLWERHMRPDFGPWDLFPKASTNASAERITDIDYALVLARTQKFEEDKILPENEKTIYGGSRENPLVFWPRGLCKNSVLL